MKEGIILFSDLFFYNPSDNLYKKIEKYLLENGYCKVGKIISESEKRYMNNEKLIYISLVQDIYGKYIMISCDKVDTEKLCELLKRCPECGSDKIIPIIPCVLSNELTEYFYQNGKLEYQVAAYDRPRTIPATRICNCCKHKWYSSEDIRRWCKAMHSEEGLTREALGLGDW